MRNLKDLNLKRWRLLSFHNGMSNYQEYLSNQGQIRMNSAKFFKKANVKVFAAPAEIYMAVLESKFLPFDEQVIQEYSQLSRKLDENNTIVTVRFKYDVQSIFKKNSGHCFLRTIYPREDGSYLISFQFSKTNMIEKARWQYGLHRIITETKSVINQSSAKVRISHYFKKYCNAKSIIFAINLQVPAGPRHFSLVFYYKIEAEVMEGAMIQNFVSCDDKYRNSRFKLIPNVSTGPWIVQSSVGRKPLIVGGALRVEYHKEAQYFEVDIDIGSSAIACSIVRFVLGYVRLLVVDLCFLIEAQSEEELPEKLLGSVRIIHLEPNSAIRCPN
ncbi:unnamed protein product [Bathycoccus prasinos]